MLDVLNNDQSRICLNKADLMTHQQLMRVYGAVMWSLSRILVNPEVSRVFVGSFWDQPLVNTTNRELFDQEQNDLFEDLQGLPRFATIRRLNDLIKRARLAKVHAYIISYLKDKMPLIGKEGKKKDLLKKLEKVYESLEAQYKIPKADFPPIDFMREELEKADFSKFRSADHKMIEKVDKMLSNDIPQLMAMIPHEDRDAKDLGTSQVTGGVFSKEQLPVGVGVLEGHGESGWIVNQDRPHYDEIFNSLEIVGGKVTGS